jgi:archaemetzincin
MTRKEIRIIAVDRVPAEVGDWLNLGLPGAFELPCRAGRSVRHPAEAWNARRRQYLADTVLNRVNRGSSLCALAVADLDLYVSSLNFVFGLADPLNRRAVVALPRLRQTYYGLPDDAEIFRQRLLKEAVYELGHVSGLSHCGDRRCVMAFSNSLTDTDLKSQDFCFRCRRLLRP